MRRRAAGVGMKLLLASCACQVIKDALPLLPKPPTQCKIICITTAAKAEEGPKEWLDNELSIFRQQGFDLIMLDLDGASEQQVDDALTGADVIYVCGGNTYFLLEKIKASGFEKIVRRELKRGAVYIGSSAGSIVCCPDISFISDMDDPSKADLEDTKGMNLIDCLLMVHMDNPGFAEQACQAVEKLKSGPQPVICLNDNQALFIDGNAISIIQSV